MIPWIQKRWNRREARRRCYTPVFRINDYIIFSLLLLSRISVKNRIIKHCDVCLFDCLEVHFYSRPGELFYRSLNPDLDAEFIIVNQRLAPRESYFF